MRATVPGQSRNGATYGGASPREHVVSAGGAILLIAFVLLFGLRWRDAAPVPVTAPARALALFTLPPPAPPPPPPPPPVPSPEPRATTPAPRAPATAPRAVPRHPAAAVADAAPPPPVPTTTIALPAGLTDATMPGLGDGVSGGMSGSSGVGAGGGDGGDGRRPRFARAEWVRQPTDIEVERAWPRGELRLSRRVEVELICAVLPDGHPDHCRVLRDSFPYHGFGAAAIRLAQGALVRPVRRDGAALELGVLIPMSFHTR